MRNHRKNPIRTLAVTLAATALVGGGAFAQQAEENDAAAGSADAASAATAQAEADAGATATFYSDLPGNQGEALGEAPLGTATAPADVGQDARYVILEHQGRSLAFPVESVEEGTVQLGVDTTADGEGLDGDATLAEVEETLRPGLEGKEEIVVVAREEGGAHVVTQIAPRSELRPESPVEVGANAQVVAFDEGQVETHEIRNADAATYGELEVGTADGASNVLDAPFWDDEGGVPAAGTADNDGMDGTENETDGATTAPADDGATTAPNANEGEGAATDDAADPAAPDAEGDAQNDGMNDGGEPAAEDDAEN